MKYRDYFKFALVRNPWDRLVSCYFDKIVAKKMFHHLHGMEFDAFVDYVATRNLRTIDRHLRLQTCLMPSNDLDFIGRFENLTEDVNEIFRRLHIDVQQQPHLNSSKHAHYSEYYNDHTRELVAKIYRDDVERFEYSFD